MQVLNTSKSATDIIRVSSLGCGFAGKIPHLVSEICDVVHIGDYCIKLLVVHKQRWLTATMQVFNCLINK